MGTKEEEEEETKEIIEEEKVDKGEEEQKVDDDMEKLKSKVKRELEEEKMAVKGEEEEEKVEVEGGGKRKRRKNEVMDKLWREFKDNLVAMRQRLFLQELRRKFDMTKTMVLKDVRAVLKELNVPLLSCVPDKYLTPTLKEFNQEIFEAAKDAFCRYIDTCEHFSNADALEEKGPVFDALMDKLSNHSLYKRLKHYPSERADLVRARVVKIKADKGNKKIVLDE